MHALLALVFVITLSDALLVNPAYKEPVLNYYRVKISVLDRLLASECSSYTKLSHDFYTISLPAMKRTYEQMVYALDECRKERLSQIKLHVGK